MKIRRLLLSEEGKKELGHIFKNGVPLQDNGIFSVAQIEGHGKIECFFVDWASLSGEERVGCLDRMHRKLGSPIAEIEAQIEGNGCFPIRSQFIVFSIDARMVIA